jgi:hypothetical protein
MIIDATPSLAARIAPVIPSIRLCDSSCHERGLFGDGSAPASAAPAPASCSPPSGVFAVAAAAGTGTGSDGLAAGSLSGAAPPCDVLEPPYMACSGKGRVRMGGPACPPLKLDSPLNPAAKSAAALQQVTGARWVTFLPTWNDSAKSRHAQTMTPTPGLLERRKGHRFSRPVLVCGWIEGQWGREGRGFIGYEGFELWRCGSGGCTVWITGMAEG